jgi:hypothetical protein
MNSVYVCIPRRLLLNPPIKYRGSTARARVTSFEFHVISGVLIEAWAAISHQQHGQAWITTGATIETQRQQYDRFADDWREVRQQRRHGASKYEAPAPQMHYTFTTRTSYKPLPRNRAMQAAGRKGYRAERKRLRSHAPTQPALIDVSHYRLLRSARLPDNGHCLRALPAALDRLRHSVGDSVPLLIGWQEESGRLRLQVASEWLSGGYARVPLPLPRSAAALALYLFLFAIRTNSYQKHSHSFALLCDRLGLPRRWGGAVAKRRIDAALDQINDLLAKLDRATLDRHNIRVPLGYRIESVDDGSGVRFIAVQDNRPDDMDAPEQAVQTNKASEAVDDGN